MQSRNTQSIDRQVCAMGVFRSQSPRAEFPAYPPDILCPYPGFFFF